MENDVARLTHFFFEASMLKKVLRAHQQTLLIRDPSDNVASHSFLTALLGYFLAQKLGANPDRVLKMCLFHDLAEVRSGDMNWLNKNCVKVFEDEIRKSQFENMPKEQELTKLLEEYEQRKTMEAKIAKGADQLAEVISLKEFAWQGNREAQHWLHEDEGEDACQQIKLMYFDLTKEIAKEVIKQSPSDWWENSWTSQNR